MLLDRAVQPTRRFWKVLCDQKSRLSECQAADIGEATVQVGMPVAAVQAKIDYLLHLCCTSDQVALQGTDQR